MGEFGMDFVHHAAGAVESFFLRIAASRVIGADHDLDHFGGDMVQDSLAPDSCQDVIRRIAVEACIEGIVGSIVFFPDGQKVLAGKVVLTVVVRDGVSDEDVFRLDVPVAFLNGFMARFPGVSMVPVLGFQVSGWAAGTPLLPIQPESGETTNREGVFSWKRSFQLVLCKQERPGLRLSIFFFHSARNGKKRYHAPWP